MWCSVKNSNRRHRRCRRYKEISVCCRNSAKASKKKNKNFLNNHRASNGSWTKKSTLYAGYSTRSINSRSKSQRWKARSMALIKQLLSSKNLKTFLKKKKSAPPHWTLILKRADARWKKPKKKSKAWRISWEDWRTLWLRLTTGTRA